MRLPNFFIIGAPKCGTTSLAAWLADHPSIFMSPIKEPFYFSSDINNYRMATNWSDYNKLFKHAQSEHMAVGEATTFYIFSKVAVPTIEQKIQNARYIVMVRNPVDMAYSWHGELVYRMYEDILDFREAWHLSSERRIGQRIPRTCRVPLLLDYQEICKLGAHVERLFSTVPRERVLVLVLDDMKKSPRQEYLKVLDFLEVQDDGRQQFPVHNAAKQMRPAWLGHMILTLEKGIYWLKYDKEILPKRGLGILHKMQMKVTRPSKRNQMPSDLRLELQDYFYEDEQLLANLIQRDLSAWQK